MTWDELGDAFLAGDLGDILGGGGGGVIDGAELMTSAVSLFGEGGVGDKGGVLEGWGNKFVDGGNCSLPAFASLSWEAQRLGGGGGDNEDLCDGGIVFSWVLSKLPERS